MDNQLTHEEILHRRQAFDKWLATNGRSMGYYLLPPSKQEYIRGMLRKAYYAGSNYEARMASWNS